MFGLGFPELLIILFIVLILFGAGKLPQIGEGLGKAIRGFRKGLAEPEDLTPPEPPASGQKKEEEPRK